VMRYEYRCDKCNVKFQVIKGMSDSGSPEWCPSCHKEARRVYSAPATCWGESCWDLQEDRKDFKLTHH